MRPKDDPKGRYLQSVASLPRAARTGACCGRALNPARKKSGTDLNIRIRPAPEASLSFCPLSPCRSPSRRSSRQRLTLWTASPSMNSEPGELVSKLSLQSNLRPLRGLYHGCASPPPEESEESESAEHRRALQSCRSREGSHRSPRSGAVPKWR